MRALRFYYYIHSSPLLVLSPTPPLLSRARRFFEMINCNFHTYRIVFEQNRNIRFEVHELPFRNRFSKFESDCKLYFYEPRKIEWKKFEWLQIENYWSDSAFLRQLTSLYGSPALPKRSALRVGKWMIYEFSKKRLFSRFFPIFSETNHPIGTFDL